jgi:hypothetical protein
LTAAKPGFILKMSLGGENEKIIGIKLNIIIYEMAAFVLL